MLVRLGPGTTGSEALDYVQCLPATTLSAFTDEFKTATAWVAMDVLAAVLAEGPVVRVEPVLVGGAGLNLVDCQAEHLAQAS